MPSASVRSIRQDVLVCVAPAHVVNVESDNAGAGGAACAPVVCVTTAAATTEAPHPTNDTPPGAASHEGGGDEQIFNDAHRSSHGAACERLQRRAAVVRKRPVLKEWQKRNATNPEEIATWARHWPDATNTGILCDLTPCLDIDLLDEDAARALQELVREHYEEAVGFWYASGSHRSERFRLEQMSRFRKSACR
jgi:hypothetical protein